MHFDGNGLLQRRHDTGKNGKYRLCGVREKGKVQRKEKRRERKGAEKGKAQRKKKRIRRKRHREGKA